MNLSEKLMALAGEVAEREAKLANGEYDSKYTEGSVENMRQTLTDAGVMFDDVAENITTGLQAADEGLVDKTAETNTKGGVLICTVKSVLARVSKLQTIPYEWDGIGLPTFKSSNPTVCDVTAGGTLVPLKIGIAVITISAPDNAPAIFTVTVSA